MSEALRRMANFDHDLEQQRAALKRYGARIFLIDAISFVPGMALNIVTRSFVRTPYRETGTQQAAPKADGLPWVVALGL